MQDVGRCSGTNPATWKQLSSGCTALGASAQPNGSRPEPRPPAPPPPHLVVAQQQLGVLHSKLPHALFVPLPRRLGQLLVQQRAHPLPFQPRLWGAGGWGPQALPQPRQPGGRHGRPV